MPGEDAAPETSGRWRPLNASTVARGPVAAGEVNQPLSLRPSAVTRGGLFGAGEKSVDGWDLLGQRKVDKAALKEPDRHQDSTSRSHEHLHGCQHVLLAPL